MATLSDLKEVKEALDAGLISQAEYDAVKSDYFRAKLKALEAALAFQMKELRAKEEALEANREFQKRELIAKEVYLKRELIAEEAFHKKELRTKEEALSANRESQKRELHNKEVSLNRELVAKEAFQQANMEILKMELRAKEEFQKKELRAKEEALEANKEFQKRELHAKEKVQQRKAEADLRAYALESIVKHRSSLMSEEQKIGLVRDYVKMSGLDGGATVNDARASKRQRVSAEKKRGTSPPQPPTPPAPAAAVPPPADAPTPADENEYVNFSDDDGEDDSDSDEPRTAERCHKHSERCHKHWTEDEDIALVAALRAGQSARAIRIGGRPVGAAKQRLSYVKANGTGSPALREYLEETCPEYVYKGPSKIVTWQPWSAEEDQTFIQAHKEGKTHSEIAAMLPGRTKRAVRSRWLEARNGRWGTAVLRAYAAECCRDD